MYKRKKFSFWGVYSTHTSEREIVEKRVGVYLRGVDSKSRGDEATLSRTVVVVTVGTTNTLLN